MKKHIRAFLGILGVLAWFALGWGVARATTLEVIYPLNDTLTALDITSPMTVSILIPVVDEDGNTVWVDRTADWLPEPGKPVRIKVNPEGNTTPVNYDFQLVTTGDVVTSAYPGMCTNADNPSPGGPLDLDYDPPLKDGPNTALLIPHDSGGRAVVQITNLDATDPATRTFIIPQDTDFDGIPDVFEKKYCGDVDNAWTCVNREDDMDDPPSEGGLPGDGIAAIDEYRGFVASGKLIRGNPVRKDLFVGFVPGPQAGDTPTLKDASGASVKLNSFFKNSQGQLDMTLLLENMKSLISDTEVHLVVGPGEWEDLFGSYDLRIPPPTGPLTLRGNLDEQRFDRQINRNALIPLGPIEPVTGKPVMKAIRLIECLDLAKTDPLGGSAKGTPDGFLKDDGNAVIFTQRIVKNFQNKVTLGSHRYIKYYTYDQKLGKWLQQGAPFQAETLIEDPGFQQLMKFALPWYATHEACGHSTDLTLTEQGTNKVSYGYHHADKSGTNIDKAIVQVVDTKTSGYNNFYIPFDFGSSDKRDMRLLNPTPTQ